MASERFINFRKYGAGNRGSVIVGKRVSWMGFLAGLVLLQLGP